MPFSQVLSGVFGGTEFASALRTPSKSYQASQHPSLSERNIGPYNCQHTCRGSCKCHDTHYTPERSQPEQCTCVRHCLWDIDVRSCTRIHWVLLNLPASVLLFKATFLAATMFPKKLYGSSISVLNSRFQLVGHSS